MRPPFPHCVTRASALSERQVWRRASWSASARAGSTLELADIVLDQAKVAFVPGEAFGAPGYGRFSFALGDDDMAEGIRRLAELVG